MFHQLNENIVIFGHGANLRSDDVLDLIILLVVCLFVCCFLNCVCLFIFFYYKCIVKKITLQFNLFKQYRRTAFEVYKHDSIMNIPYHKRITKCVYPPSHLPPIWVCFCSFFVFFAFFLFSIVFISQCYSCLTKESECEWKIYSSGWKYLVSNIYKNIV